MFFLPEENYIQIRKNQAGNIGQERLCFNQFYPYLSRLTIKDSMNELLFSLHSVENSTALFRLKDSFLLQNARRGMSSPMLPASALMVDHSLRNLQQTRHQVMCEIVHNKLK